MTVYNPGFSERVFEFSFNAEYAHRNRALLTGAPYIPTQNAEKHLGFDVAFELITHGVTNCVALQHKLARLVDKQSPRNKHFWSAASKAPYFAFRIDVDQYNLIHLISSIGIAGLELYYCAPLFTTLKAMNGHYLASDVEQHSVWIDVGKAGAITDSSSHTILYTKSGSGAYLFSENPRELQITRGRRATKEVKARPRRTKDELTETYRKTLYAIRSYWPDRRRIVSTESLDFIPPDDPPVERAIANDADAVMATSDLLTKYVGMSQLAHLASPD